MSRAKSTARQQNNNSITTNLAEVGIYEGGAVNQITVDDLCNNKVAITQVVNDYNIQKEAVTKLRKEKQDILSDLEFQKTSPFINIIAACFNVLGTVLVGYGVNFNTDTESKVSGTPFIVIGAIIIIIINIACCLYGYIRRWFNK